MIVHRNFSITKTLHYELEPEEMCEIQYFDPSLK